MEKNRKTPIIVGVTGHRDPREQDIEKLKGAVRDYIVSLSDTYPHSPVVMMTSIAEGGDQLCAETALELGLEIITVLPMPAEEYAEDFEGAAEEKFREMLDKSSEVIVTPYIEPYQESRDYLYRQAGLYAAFRSHILMALWDGTPGEPDGCGTSTIADIKRGIISALTEEKPCCPGGAVLQIVTPRAKSSPSAIDALAGNTVFYGDEGALADFLSEIDSVNAGRV